MSAITIPMHAERACLVILPMEQARICPHCGSAHAIMIARQEGEQIGLACLVCDGRK